MSLCHQDMVVTKTTPSYLPVISMSAPSSTGHRALVVQSPHDLVGGWFASHTWQLQTLKNQTPTAILAVVPIRKGHRLRNMKLPRKLESLSASWTCATCGTANFNHPNLQCQWCLVPAASRLLQRESLNEISTMLDCDEVVEPWICAPCGTPNYNHDFGICHWCAVDRTNVLSSGLSMASAKDDSTEIVTEAGSSEAGDCEQDIVEEQDGNSLRCVKISGLPEEVPRSWNYEEIGDLFYHAGCAVSHVYIQMHADGATCNGQAFMFFSDEASISTARTCDGAVFTTKSCILTVSVVDDGALQCHALIVEIGTQLESILASCSPWAKSSVSKLMELVLADTSGKSMLHPLLELLESMQSAQCVTKQKVESWISSWISTLAAQPTTGPQRLSDEAVSKVPQRPPRVAEKSSGRVTPKTAIPLAEPRLPDTPQLQTEPKAESGLMKRRIVVPVVDSWDDLDPEQLQPTCLGRLVNLTNLEDRDASQAARSEPMETSDGEEKLIGEFVGRIKRPEGGHRRTGKVLFGLVVCRGKELDRLRKLAFSHGWQSDDLEIFVHKNNWDASVQRLFPDDKVKVKLLCPKHDTMRLKGVSLVKVNQ